jgi:hypothetical protein
MADLIFAILLGLVVCYYLYSRNATNLIVWVLSGYLLTYNFGLTKSRTLSVIAGVAVAWVVVYVSTREHFEQEKLDKKTDNKDPEPTGKSTPHVDLGTTILHAYRNLSPEQIGGMKRDTKELMELQKELMSTLAEMKPAIEQGAELLGSFSQFFGSGT